MERPVTQAEIDILAEREKQRRKWGDEHDDDHQFGLLRIQAAALACDGTDAYVEHPDGDGGVNFDPWGLVKKHGYSGTKPDKRRALVIAAALLIAEIERIDRADPPPYRLTPDECACKGAGLSTGTCPDCGSIPF